MASDRLDDVHERAMRRFDAIWSVERDERAQALRDRRFEAIRGAQWEGQYGLEDGGEQEGPSSARLEVPKFLRPIRRMRGEYRAARKTVDFKPKGDADRQDADNLDGLYRADQNDSPAGPTAHTDIAFNEGSAGGFGGWRLRARYEDEGDEENEHQRIEFVPVYDADQSMWFYGSTHQDRSDAKAGFLLFTMLREDFEADYPDHSPSTFDKPGEGEDCWEYDWTRPDDLTLAEYFEVEDESVVRHKYVLKAMEGIEGIEPDEQWFDEDDLSERRDDGTTLRSELRAKGYRPEAKRTVKRQRVHKYLLSGTEVLEDEGYIAGDQIPLVPFFFEYTVIDGITRFQGMVRPVIDSQRLLNIATSNVADTLAAPTDSTPIVAPEQIDQKLAKDWADRKVKRPALLVLKPVYGDDGQILQAGLSGMIEPPAVSQAAAALLQFSDSAVADLMGETDRPETVPTNTSAAAIQLVNDQADVNDYLWHDNFALALARSGRIWLGMAKELYAEPGRKMVAIDREGGETEITLSEPTYGKSGQYLGNDLTSGQYNVVVDVGPATKTRQDATVRAMLAVGEKYAAIGDVENAKAAIGLAVVNMEGEGLDGARSAVRKQLLTSGWVEPNEEEKAALEAAAAQPQQPDPNMLLAQAQLVAAQAEVTKAETGRIEAETRRIVAEAQSEKARADAAAALAGIDRADRKQVLDEVKAETSSDRDDDRLQLDAAKTVADHNRQDMRDLNGNAG